MAHRCSATGSPEQLVIENPQLWWPNGYGRQDLYTVEVTLCFEGKELDCWKRRIGLRTMTVDRSKNEWGENFAICVNGVDIFAMGADYIPEDHLLGRVTPETTRGTARKVQNGRILMQFVSGVVAIIRRTGSMTSAMSLDLSYGRISCLHVRFMI